MISATRLKPAYRPNAPTVCSLSRMKGNVILRTAAQNRQVATAKPIPTSRWERGKTSAL